MHLYTSDGKRPSRAIRQTGVHAVERTPDSRRTAPRLVARSILGALAGALLTGCAVGPRPAAPVLSPSPSPTVTLTPSPSATSAPTATPTPTLTPSPTATPTETPVPSLTPTPLHPMDVEFMRQQTYAGSELVIVQTLGPGANYDRYVASYESEGLTIYGLLTVPRGEAPETGWPLIVFLHGYIPPEQYRTTERYAAYQDGFARNGYVTLKPDYRGHGDSEGSAEQGSRGPGYAVDVLNAVASLQRLPESDPERVGMWGHSLGGSLTLRAMVVSGDVKAGVIWAGVVATYEEIWEARPRWVGGEPTVTPGPDVTVTPREAGQLFAYGTFDENPEFWAAIDPVTYLDDLSGPVQIHHATGDQSVPVEFSEKLYERLQEAGQPAELYTYQGDNHNISANFATAMERSVAFFDNQVLGGR